MKSVFKILGSVLLAEILTLFINLTLSFSGHVLLRMLCAFCTAAILAGLCAQAGYSVGTLHRKQHLQLSKIQTGCLGAVSSLPFLVCWGLLLCAWLDIISPDFYRIYKLLCAPFLNVCNLFSADVSALSLPVSGLIVLFVLSFLPLISFCIAYYMTVHEKTIEQIMYQK